MKVIISIFLILTGFYGFNQNIIVWTPGYELNINDFGSVQTEISNEFTSYAITSGANIDFRFQMSTYEFMLTKNFNSKVKSYFNRNAAVIVAPDTITALQLVKVGQLSFDLTELYARRFRKQIYEQKATFSSSAFFQPIIDTLRIELNSESARILKLTDIGKNESLLMEEHEKILEEIESLSDFCFECKPKKKKKNRRESGKRNSVDEKD